MPIAIVRHFARKYQVSEKLAVECLSYPVGIDNAICSGGLAAQVPSYQPIAIRRFLIGFIRSGVSKGITRPEFCFNTDDNPPVYDKHDVRFCLESRDIFL